MGKYATVFQAEVFAILACVYEIQTNAGPDKYVSICSDTKYTYVIIFLNVQMNYM
jgi:hypothetical protein